MPKLFVDGENEIVIKVVVADSPNGQVFAGASKDELDLEIDDLKDEDVAELSFTFKQPSFKDSVDMAKSVLSSTDGQSLDFNPLAARYEKMVTLIKSWNLTDVNGNPVEPTEANISKLHPVVANTVALQLDAQTPTA
jgi:hypothetical protein